jgi:hypothetical protein
MLGPFDRFTLISLLVVLVIVVVAIGFPARRRRPRE